MSHSTWFLSVSVLRCDHHPVRVALCCSAWHGVAARSSMKPPPVYALRCCAAGPKMSKETYLCHFFDFIFRSFCAALPRLPSLPHTCRSWRQWRRTPSRSSPTTARLGCSVLQCDDVYWCVLQCVAVCCSVLQCVSVEVEAFKAACLLIRTVFFICLACMYACLHLCMNSCMYICLCVRTYVCMYICL